MKFACVPGIATSSMQVSRVELRCCWEMVVGQRCAEAVDIVVALYLAACEAARLAIQAGLHKTYTRMYKALEPGVVDMASGEILRSHSKVALY